MTTQKPEISLLQIYNNSFDADEAKDLSEEACRTLVNMYVETTSGKTSRPDYYFSDENLEQLRLHIENDDVLRNYFEEAML